MLRLLLALLVAANALFYVWTAGWFDGLVPWHARGDREPDRITSQLHPEAVVVVRAGDPADISNGLCFEAGPITSADAGAAEGILNATLPAGSWTDVRGESPADRLGGGHVYRVSNIDAATAVKLADLKLDAAGRIGFRNCPTPVLR